MIEIPQPSLALNAMNSYVDEHYNVPGTLYDMWDTWNVPSTETVDSIMTKIMVMTLLAKEKVKCLVINSHGFYDKGLRKSGKQKLISTGGFGFGIGEGINKDNAHKFSQIKGMVRCIILVSCGTAKKTRTNSLRGDGEYLCSTIARAASAYVIAPRITQAATFRKLPKNHIDNFEGEIVRFNSRGEIDDYAFLGRRLIKQIFK